MTDMAVRFAVFRIGVSATVMALSGAVIILEHGPLHLLRFLPLG